jgi:hypothetical protein
VTVDIIRPADRAAWLAARRQDVTASVAGALFGVHPYATAYGLWAEKSGRVEPDDIDNKVLRRGRILEPAAIEMLREERPDWTIHYHRDNAYYRDPAARMGATPDAFAERPDIFGTGIIQVKTVSEDKFRAEWLDEETDEIVLPLWIAVQAIQEAELTGAAWATVALMIVGRGIDMEVIDVPLHEGVRRRLRSSIADFWALVESGREPDPDWGRDGATVLDVYRDSTPDRRDLAADIDLDNLVGRYVEARQARLMSAKIEDTNRPQIIRAMGSAEAAFTTNWHLSARTMTRVGDFGQPIKTRVLRVKPREDSYADRF